VLFRVFGQALIMALGAFKIYKIRYCQQARKEVAKFHFMIGRGLEAKSKYSRHNTNQNLIPWSNI